MTQLAGASLSTSGLIKVQAAPYPPGILKTVFSPPAFSQTFIKVSFDPRVTNILSEKYQVTPIPISPAEIKKVIIAFSIKNLRATSQV